MDGIRDYLTRIKEKMPSATGIYDVLFAPDRDALLAAIARCPELLTDQGAAGFNIVAGMAEMLGEPRVTEAIRQRQATVQAIRETRA
jgi:hypothetical protein